MYRYSKATTWSLSVPQPFCLARLQALTLSPLSLSGQTGLRQFYQASRELAAHCLAACLIENSALLTPSQPFFGFLMRADTNNMFLAIA